MKKIKFIITIVSLLLCLSFLYITIKTPKNDFYLNKEKYYYISTTYNNSNIKIVTYNNCNVINICKIMSELNIEKVEFNKNWLILTKNNFLRIWTKRYFQYLQKWSKDFSRYKDMLNFETLDSNWITYTIKPFL